jgi:hypothetical protein
VFELGAHVGPVLPACVLKFECLELASSTSTIGLPPRDVTSSAGLLIAVPHVPFVTTWNVPIFRVEWDRPTRWRPKASFLLDGDFRKRPS